ncbi:MAG TPA: hypothetical protein VKZ41_07630 [Gemmatimonadales bacterium]|nr:hypothetical protein [Gemmatimonadales bacterium]
MTNAYSMGDLEDFLDHAGDRGLMPAATAKALAVAARNVFGVLTEEERQDLSQLDMSSVIKRFTNKRARDFNPSSLKEYARRVNRAVDLYAQWRADPANFTVKTRTTAGTRKKERNHAAAEPSEFAATGSSSSLPPQAEGGYQSSIPVRPGFVITLVNIPPDLTTAEAERLASFVRMLAVDS